jgi:hypothetical protein
MSDDVVGHFKLNRTKQDSSHFLSSPTAVDLVSVRRREQV